MTAKAVVIAVSSYLLFAGLVCLAIILMAPPYEAKLFFSVYTIAGLGGGGIGLWSLREFKILTSSPDAEGR
ncbi:MAG: hypothetical protein HYS89_02805 [Candidatus Colwellbacteria bacterium]|nr:hypothetical protein [Candidatus Colwellbacteria bacterium]